MSMTRQLVTFQEMFCICLFASNIHDANLGSSFPTSASVFQESAHFMVNDIIFSRLEKLQRMHGGWCKARLPHQNSHFTRSKRTPIKSNWVYSFISQRSRDENESAAFAHHLDTNTNPLWYDDYLLMSTLWLHFSCLPWRFKQTVVWRHRLPI